MSEPGLPRSFHDVDHRLVRRVGIGIDDDNRILGIAGGALERIGKRGDIGERKHVLVD